MFSAGIKRLVARHGLVTNMLSLQFTVFRVNPLSANPIRRQTHSNNSLAVADELFECLWRWCLNG